jgi:hypothetical protein
VQRPESCSGVQVTQGIGFDDLLVDMVHPETTADARRQRIRELTDRLLFTRDDAKRDLLRRQLEQEIRQARSQPTRSPRTLASPTRVPAAAPAAVNS